MADIEEQLISKDNIRTQFQIDLEKIENWIEELRQMNDGQQSQSVQNMTQSDVKMQKSRFQNSAAKLKTELQRMDRLAKGREQKAKISQLQKVYTQQVERNKRILKSFINQSFEHKFARISVIKQSRAVGGGDCEEQLKYFVDGNIVKIVPKEERQSFLQPEQPLKQNQVSDTRTAKAISMDEEVIDQDLLDLENLLIDERQKELDDIEEEALKLNLISNQMAGLVDEHDKQLNRAKGNTDAASNNLKETNNELTQGATIQRGNKKILYMGIVVLILIIAVIVLVVVVVIK